MVRERKRGSKILAVLSKAKTKTVTVVVGQASYTISAGKITTVKVTLGKTGKGLLKRFHKLKVKVKVTVTTTSGQKQLATKTVTIKAPKAKKKKG
jgi:organic hydroperoxide reductase OsmC/OhrA